MNNTVTPLPIRQSKTKTQAADCLPSSVATQVNKGKIVTFNQGRRLITAQQVRHLVVLKAA